MGADRAAVAGSGAAAWWAVERSPAGDGGDLLAVPHGLAVAGSAGGFPAWQTAWKRHDRWAKDGTWDRLVAAVQGRRARRGELDWLVRVDSTVARAHQHAAGARPAEPAPGLTGGTTGCGTAGWDVLRSSMSRDGLSRARPALGRSRGGLEHEGPPQRRRTRTSAGHHPDGGAGRRQSAAEPLLDDGASRPRRGPGRPRTPPGLTHSGQGLLPPLDAAGAYGAAESPPPSPRRTDQIAHRHAKGPPAADHRIRRRRLQAPQRRRTPLQPAQAVARHRHPLRQETPGTTAAACSSPRSCSGSRVIHETRPSGAKRRISEEQRQAMSDRMTQRHRDSAASVIPVRPQQ